MTKRRVKYDRKVIRYPDLPFTKDQVVEFDRAAMLRDLRPDAAYADLRARQEKPLVGQVTEVTAGHVEICWENGRVCQYGPAPYLGRIGWIREALD